MSVRLPAISRLAPVSLPSRRTALVSLLVVGLASIMAVSLVLAYFSATRSVAATFGTKLIFSGARTTPGFGVLDSSSGSEVDRSSATAYAGDGRATTTSHWSSSFTSDRYLEFDLNAPLPGGTPASGFSFGFDFASAGAGDTSCFYFEVRRASTGAVVATHGNAGAPVGCVTGTSFASVDQAIPSVTTSDGANDLRIRIYARNSGSGSLSIDRAVANGTAAYTTVTLYPVLFTDAADATPETIRWALDGP